MRHLIALVMMLTAAQWDDLAQCESSGRWYVSTGNGYYGGLQIAETTWRSHGGLDYASYPHYADKDSQIVVAETILADQGLDAWPVCSYIVGLR
jgi:ABC-type tungstate transport system permease subunit